MELKVLVSSCLLGDNTKYDGGNNLQPQMISDLKDFKIYKVCPEVDGGLSIPRNPSEIVGDKVKSITNVDVTNEYQKGAKHALDICLENNIKYAILKAKSPSCGSGKIYDGSFSHTIIAGNGVTTKLLIEHGIEVYTEENYVELLKKIKK